VVPITRTVVTPAAAKLIPRCTEEEMYTLLTEDLAEAARLLPPTPGPEKARVANIAAYTLLAKVYLTFGKPAEAKTALEEAMKNTSYGLESTTKKVFDVGNKMNREIIFALYYNKTNDNGHGYWYSANTDVLADINNPTSTFKAIYDSEKDNRLPLISSYTKIKDNLFAMTKWYDTYDATYTTQVGNDFPHLRYADVVLMYAEAKAYLNEMDAAVWNETIKPIRQRAGLSGTDFPSSGDYTQIVRDERRVELALEGLRYFDLIRWINYKDSKSQGVIDLLNGAVYGAKELNGGRQIDEFKFNSSRDILWSLPLSETQLVPTLLPNNSGY